MSQDYAFIETFKTNTLTTKWLPAYIWPLAVVNCWKGGPAQHLLPNSNALGADIPIRKSGFQIVKDIFGTHVTTYDGGALRTMGHVLEFSNIGQSTLGLGSSGRKIYRL